MSAASRRVKCHLKLFLWATIEKIEKREKKRTLCLGRSSHWPLSLHIFCVSERMVHCLLTIKTMGEKTHNFLQAMLSSISSCYMNSFTKSCKCVFWSWFCVNCISTFTWMWFCFFIPRRRRRHGTTERLRQSNDLIAGKEEKEAKAVILLYDIYLVVK